MVHRLLATAYEKSFNVGIRTEEYVWDGAQVTAPAKLPGSFKKISPEEAKEVEFGGTFSTQAFGYAFRKSTFAELAERIEHDLQAPIDLIHGFGDQRFDFDVHCAHIEPDGLLYGLKELGFKIEPKKLTRKTTVITPAK